MATTNYTKRHYVYRLENTWGVPQCGCEIIDFEEWYEVEQYLDENPRVVEMIEDGYAGIFEVFDG